MGTESHGSQENFRYLLLGFFGLLFRTLGFKDSRASEGDIVKLTKGVSRLLFLGFLENLKPLKRILTGSPMPLSDGRDFVQKPISVLHEALNKWQPINQRSFAMRKLALAFLLIFACGVCVAHAQDKYSVSGTVRCVGTADVLISLSTHEEWAATKSRFSVVQLN